MKKAVRYWIEGRDEYIEGYYFTLGELVQLVNRMQTSDPMDNEHMKTKDTIKKYLDE